MFRDMEEDYWDKCIEYEGPGVKKYEEDSFEYISQLDNLKEAVNHLKRAKYREMKGLSADEKVTDEMLAETTEAEMFPQASQYAEEDYDEDDDVTTTTTDGSAGEASQESGAKEEWTQQYFELSPHELDDHNDAPKSYWLDRIIGTQLVKCPSIYAKQEVQSFLVQPPYPFCPRLQMFEVLHRAVLCEPCWRSLDPNMEPTEIIPQHKQKIFGIWVGHKLYFAKDRNRHGVYRWWMAADDFRRLMQQQKKRQKN